MLIDRCDTVNLKLLEHKPKLWLGIVLLVACMSAFFPGDADAGTGLTICPSNITFATAGGFKEERIIKVSNNGSEPVSIKARASDIDKNKSGNDKIRYFAGNTQQKKVESFAHWLSIKPSAFILKAKSSTYVKLTVSVPDTIHAGVRAAWIVFDVGSGMKSNVSVAGRLVSTVILQTPGNVAVRFDVESFKADTLNIGSNPGFHVSVRNLGNNAYKSTGRIEVRTLKNKLVSEVALPGKNIPPGSSRLLEAKSSNNLPIGIYRCSLYVADGDNYKGPLGRLLIVFPWAGVLGVIIMALSIYFLLFRKRQDGSAV